MPTLFSSLTACSTGAEELIIQHGLTPVLLLILAPRRQTCFSIRDRANVKNFEAGFVMLLSDAAMNLHSFGAQACGRRVTNHRDDLIEGHVVMAYPIIQNKHKNKQTNDTETGGQPRQASKKRQSNNRNPEQHTA